MITVNDPRYIELNERANEFVDAHPECPTVVTEEMLETAEFCFDGFANLSREAGTDTDMGKLCAIRAFVFSGFLTMMEEIYARSGNQTVVDKLH